MYGIFVKAAEISQLEADDKQVPVTDIAWIGNVPKQLSVSWEISGEWEHDITSYFFVYLGDKPPPSAAKTLSAVDVYETPDNMARYESAPAL